MEFLSEFLVGMGRPFAAPEGRQPRPGGWQRAAGDHFRPAGGLDQCHQRCAEPGPLLQLPELIKQKFKVSSGGSPTAASLFFVWQRRRSRTFGSIRTILFGET